jgi:hypothetical protein
MPLSHITYSYATQKYTNTNIQNLYNKQYTGNLSNFFNIKNKTTRDWTTLWIKLVCGQVLHTRLIHVLFCHSWYFFSNYTLYKNPGFWLANSRCIFHVFSYLGLISFIFTVAGVFAWGFNFFSLYAVVFAKTYFTMHEDLTFFPSVPWYLRKRISLFTLACFKRPNSFGILQPLSDITNRNTTTVPAEGNSSKCPIVFNNCQVTNNKNKIFLKTTNKKVLFI